MQCVLIDSPVYRKSIYGTNHPLAIPRSGLAIDLIRSYGALRADETVRARRASRAELEWFHTPDYVAAIERCEREGGIFKAYRKRYNVGNFENPWFEGLFTIPATAVGATILGAEQVIRGKTVFSPTGGMHHAMPDRARGFCFFNDAALGIMRFRREGMRVIYLDVDAHQGDGVAFAFRDDPGVLVVSAHMDTSYAFPFKGGGIEDAGPIGNAVNIPLPKDTNDSEYRMVLRTLWPQLFHAFKPDAAVLQSGTDILFCDPLGRFRISNRFFLEIVHETLRLAPKKGRETPALLVIGGGGYHPIALARAWTGLWAMLSHRTLPQKIPPEGARLLRRVPWDEDEEETYFEGLFRNRLDEPLDGPVRPDLEVRLERLLETHPIFKPKRRQVSDWLSI